MKDLLIRALLVLEIFFSGAAIAVTLLSENPIDRYTESLFHGSYNKQCFLTHELDKVCELYVDGMYVILQQMK